MVMNLNWVEDIILTPLVYPAALLLKAVRRMGMHRLPLCRATLMKVGVFPIKNHFYEPQFDFRFPDPEFSEDRVLPGIDWNEPSQLEMLDRFTYSDELADVSQEPSTRKTEMQYSTKSGFGPGDAEYWYHFIRATKPARIIEIGSGSSTLMAIKAINKNIEEDANDQCEHICIEPFLAPWLEKTGVSVIRKKVEEVELSFFSQLQDNDILFIDSSHVIRPQGDVLFEYLQVLPSLNKGVVVHAHDIFSPKNYPAEWLQEKVRLWNEQYLLEAFLSNNDSWKIVGALNYLRHKHYDRLKSVARFMTPDREPGSFYIRKIS
jgi:hypothetical protein